MKYFNQNKRKSGASAQSIASKDLVSNGNSVANSETPDNESAANYKISRPEQGLVVIRSLSQTTLAKVQDITPVPQENQKSI